MTEALPFLISGIILGLTAGMAPGPMLTLVIAETLKHSKFEGFKVAIAPLITDAPIVAVTLLILARVAHVNTILGILTLFGAVFVAYLGYESLTTKRVTINTANVKPQSLKRGIIINALNPHPYLFWLTVGGPLTIKSYQINFATAIAFIVSFYVFLIGTKMVVAAIVDRSRIFVSGSTYVWIMRFLGLALFMFAVLFFKQAIGLLI